MSKENQQPLPDGFDSMTALLDDVFSGCNKINSIQNDREYDYGDATISMRSIGEFWGTYLSRKEGVDIKLDETDVALMMTLFKINRNAFRRKEDNFIDGEAYANFATSFYANREVVEK